MDAILGYQLFDQQVTENCFSLRIELEKQLKKEKKKRKEKKKNVLSMIRGNILDMKGGQNVIVALLYLASGEERSDN